MPYALHQEKLYKLAEDYWSGNITHNKTKSAEDQTQKSQQM